MGSDLTLPVPLVRSGGTRLKRLELGTVAGPSQGQGPLEEKRKRLAEKGCESWQKCGVFPTQFNSNLLIQGSDPHPAETVWGRRPLFGTPPSYAVAKPKLLMRRCLLPQRGPNPVPRVAPVTETAGVVGVIGTAPSAPARQAHVRH